MSPGEQDASPPPQSRSGALARFRYEYGAEPLHLLAVVASLLLCAYALLRITEISGGGRVLIWLAVAVVLHDLIAWPLYSLFLRIAEGAAGAAIKTRAGALLALNHVRIPAAISALLLLTFFPLILRVDPDYYEAVTGIGVEPYLSRWLLISAALFAGSALIYAVRLRRGKGTEARPTPASGASARAMPAPLAALLRGATAVVLGAGAFAALWVLATAIVGLLSSGL